MINNTKPKRSLILAGGGLKVAFQAGVLQVWLDEAGLKFDHYDGASGGLFNLVMCCQGLSGKDIAENWRGLPILKGLSINLIEFPKLFHAESLLQYDRWRKNILKKYWGLDWQKINASTLDATFNIYNFSKHEIEVRSPSQMNEDALIAGVSLPMWFPPVIMDNQTYIDSVYYTDANIMEAVRRDVDEIWVIWTVSDADRWKDGFIDNYFQIIETSANGRFNADIERIRKSNQALAAGENSEFSKHIEIKILKAEVPLHYLINTSKKKFTKAVDMGVDMARTWIDDNT